MQNVAHTTLEQPLLGNVEIVRQLGEGGFSKVYLGKQLSTGQLVAIKALRWDGHLSPAEIAQQIARLDRETSICASVHHPHIVRLLDRGQLGDGTPVAVFEYVPGETLREVLRRGGPLCPTRVQGLMGQVLDALACAHAAGVIHRDLKPDNIMVTSTGSHPHAKVLDFGLGALVTWARGTDYKSLTLSGETLGTPSYCAPEQLRGEPPSPQSDVYAWGLVVLECLVGQSVMAGATVAEVFHRQLSADEIPLPPALMGHPLGSLLRRVLRKSTRARPNDVVALCEEFRALHVTDLIDAFTQSDNGGYRVETTGIGRSPVRTYRERRQITVLCCSLSVATTRDTEPDFETLDAVHQDQLVSCADTLARFGGTLGGRLGDKLLSYFGHPRATDSDTKRAARAALELVAQVQRRSELLQTELGLRLDLRVALHTGFVVGSQNDDPSGTTPNIPLRLESYVAPGQILVTQSTRQLLEHYAEFVPAGARAVTGGKDPLPIFELLSELSADSSAAQSGLRKQPLVGRSELLQAALEAFDTVQSGLGRSILLRGDAGIGKSRLLAELRRRVGTQLTRAMEARCLPEERNTALHPIIEMLRREFELNSAPEENAQSLLRRLKTNGVDVDRCGAICCAWFGFPLIDGLAPSSLSPQLQKAELLQSLVALVRPRDKHDITLLVVEDLHWADPTTLEFLVHLQSAIPELPLLAVQTARPEFVPSKTPPHHQELQLTGLAAEDVAVLVRQLTNGIGISRAELQAIVERTDGVPLFVEELTKMLLDRLTSEDTFRYPALGERQLQDAPLLSLPITLRESLTSRLDRLGLAKETAQLASAIGREFDYELLAAATLRDSDSLQDELSTLANADLIYERRHHEHSTYLFRHALIRDAAYESLAREERVAAHSRIIEALLERGNPRPVELARHYAGAGRYSAAATTMAEAARFAQERSLHEETLAMCEQALAWNRSRTDEETSRAETELAINRTLLPALIALRGLGTEELLTLSRRNAALLELLDAHKPGQARSARTEQEHRNRWLEFQRVHFSADSARAVVMGESLLSDMRASGQRQPQLQVLPLLAQAYHWKGDLTTALQRFEDALALYDEQQDSELWVEYGLEPRCQSYYLMSHALTYAGRPDSAKRCVDQCLSWAKKLDCPRAADGGIFFGALRDYLCGDKAAVKASASQLQANQALGAADQWLVAGWRMVYDWAEGTTEHTTSFVDSALQMGHLGAMCWFEAMLAETDLDNDRVDAAVSRLRASIARCADTGEVVTLPIAHTLLGECLTRQAGNLTSDAAQHYQSALRISANHGSHWLTLITASKFAERCQGTEHARRATEILATSVAGVHEGRETPVYRFAVNQLRLAH